MWIQEMNNSPAFWRLVPATKIVKNTSDAQHAIFAHELQSALKLTVGFKNVYCEL
jgi:hypothetical protein